VPNFTWRERATLALMQWSGLAKALPALAGVDTSRGWISSIRESFTGAWQRNVEVELTNVLSHPTVFACVTLIADDISKQEFRLVERDDEGIWTPVESPAFSPVLRRPNHYQARIEFVRSWVISVLTQGNTYVFLERDRRGVVIAMHVLDPARTRVLVAPNGEVYYQLARDQMAGHLDDGLILPASEIIHHKINTLYHQLVGLSPIYASGLSAVLGLRMQTNSAHFFGNGSSPGGLLIAPPTLKQEQADALKQRFKAATSGTSYGDLVVLTGGLEYKPMAQTAVDAQLSDQWKSTAEAVCSTFHVPAYMVGVGPPPSYANIQPLNIQYFAQALQALMTGIEDLVDHALGLDVKVDGRQLGTEFNKDDLLWMDTAALVETESKKIGGAIGTPNESRRRLNLKPVTGGDDVYSQQQNWSLEALARRDQMALSPPPTPTTLPQADDEPVPDDPDAGKALLTFKVKRLLCA
jgi:HK97 family phage portal protein